MQEDLALVQREQERLQAELKRLQSEMESLVSDPLALEREARRTLGMARPNEIVFQRVEEFEDPASLDTSAATE